MGEYNIKFKGIVDNERNPFSTPSWSKEHSAGGELGSGKPMQPTAIENFQKVLDKDGRLDNIREPHREKYATFQAIRWGYAVIQGNLVVPTEKWNEISPKLGFVPKEKRNLFKIEKPKTENIITKPAHSETKSLIAVSSEKTLIEKLKIYNLPPVISNYLDNGNLRNKTPNDILWNFTFGNSISRAFHYESPSIQYGKWSSTKDGKEIIQQLKKVKTQSVYDTILFDIANSLSQSWKTKNEKSLPSKMNIGIALKITNLLLKHLVYVNLNNRKDLISFLHVPWDKFTLQPLKNIWIGNPRIASSSSQGFVKTKNQYLELHEFITNITQKAGVNRINYEFWAWDSEH